MRKITVSVDEETYRRASKRAAELGISVSRLVRDYLGRLADREHDFVRLERLEAELRGQIVGFTAKDGLTRGELHERKH